MTILRSMAVLAGLAAPAAAFVSLQPRGGVRTLQPLPSSTVAVPTGPAVPKARLPPEGSACAAGPASFAAAALSLGAVLLAHRQHHSRQQQGAQTALQAARGRKTGPARQPNLSGTIGLLTIRKTYNNTHVVLCNSQGKVIWTTSEKRYGKMLPNTNYAVEAAIYTAEKLGIQKVTVNLKGPNAGGLQGAIAAIRNTGIDVASCFVSNNIAYGGNRPAGVRR
mmetsp:Transcript_81502/g.225743  ORF Transcript_81502/g.225743 Transcript_81502/m.225743 type:complete len:222 (-) Transcript_81502:80-745(-)